MTILDTTNALTEPDDDGIDGQGNAAPQDTIASIPLIREQCAHRRDTIRSMLRINNQTGALVRRSLGYDANMDAKAGDAICKRAAAVIKTIETDIKAYDKAYAKAVKDSKTSGGPVLVTAPEYEDVLFQRVQPFALVAYRACQEFAGYRKRLDKVLIAQAQLLPVWPWWEAINGVGPRGLAIIVGECGDLSDYATHHRVWKRMGLAVMDGTRQGGLPAGSPAEAWIAHGYSPRRRSAMWTIGDSLLKKDNAYRDLYLERKARECEKAVEDGRIVVSTTKATVDNWHAAGLTDILQVKKLDLDLHRTAGHIAKRAQRYVEKRLLRDLWRAWRDS